MSIEIPPISPQDDSRVLPLLKIPDQISAELVGITDQAVMHTTLTQILVSSLHEPCRSV